jgi:ornithine carbamoyltransferase
MMRTFQPWKLQELAQYATIPVINGLTDNSHPCQLMADVMTFEEHRGPIEGKTVAWTGDDNNVLASWAHAAERFKFQLNVATPPELAPKKAMRDFIKSTGAPIMLGTDPEAAVKGADCVVTDTWVSMGDQDYEARLAAFEPHSVDEALMAEAADDAVFLHCLPAHSGEEVADAVIDGPRSLIWDEAENRLHAQKAVLAWCFGAF